MNWQLTSFDTDIFIRDYWQKRPCLIKQAFPDFQSPVSPEELAGLACEEAVHSRLIMEKGGKTPWQLRYGPFKERDFVSLPKTHYSLLVSECEKWIPEFDDLLSSFRFIPSWRVDDVMISYAPDGGSVGAHIDEYDVFLLQIEGKRRWQFDNNRPTTPPTLIAGLDLSILENFDPDNETVLEPGDMLYLPPGIAHHGVAIDVCMTCSIGFRAPTAAEVLESFAFETDKNNLGLNRYTDPDVETQRHRCEITDDEINRFKNMVLDLMDQPRTHWVDSIGKLLSDSVIDDDAGSRLSSFQDIINNRWMINPDSKTLHYKNESKIRFYYNGMVSELAFSKQALSCIESLCGGGEVTPELIQQCNGNSLLMKLLLDMANSGAIVPDRDEY